MPTITMRPRDLRAIANATATDRGRYDLTRIRILQFTSAEVLIEASDYTSCLHLTLENEEKAGDEPLTQPLFVERESLEGFAQIFRDTDRVKIRLRDTGLVVTGWNGTFRSGFVRSGSHEVHVGAGAQCGRWPDTAGVSTRNATRYVRVGIKAQLLLQAARALEVGLGSEDRDSRIYIDIPADGSRNSVYVTNGMPGRRSNVCPLIAGTDRTNPPHMTVVERGDLEAAP